MKTQQRPPRCANCGIRVRKNSCIAKNQPSDVQDLLNLWIQPKEITDSDHICSRCHDSLLQSLELPEESRTRQLGHKDVCIMCGRSLLKVRSQTVFQPGQSMEQWVQRARVVATVLDDYEIKVDDKACMDCSNEIDSKCQKKNPDPKPAKIQQKNASDQHSELSKSIQTCREESFISPEDIVKVEMPDPIEDDDCTSKTEMMEHEDYIPNENINCEIKIEYDPEESLNESLYSANAKDDNPELRQYTDEVYNEMNDQCNFEDVAENIPADYAGPGTITLPNIRRAGLSSNQCLFRGCKNKTRHHIPRHVRTTILRDHKYFIASKCRVCFEHLEKNSYEELYGSRNKYRNINIFTAAHLEEMIDLLVPKSTEHLMDYEHASHMPEYILEYWTGIPNKMFKEILNITGLWHQDSMYLVALLCKLRTEDTNERVAKIFRTCRKSFERKLLVVRKAMIDHSECIKMITSTIYNKRKKKVYLDYFSDQPEPTEEQMMNRIKWERRKMRWAAAKEAGASPSTPLETKKPETKPKTKPPKKWTSSSKVLNMPSTMSFGSNLSSSSAQSKTNSNLDGSLSEQWINTQSLLEQWNSPPLQSNESESAPENAPTLLDQWNSASIQLNQLSNQLKDIPSMLNQWNNSNVKVTPTLLSEMNIPKTSIIEVEFPKLKKAEKRTFNDALPQENSKIISKNLSNELPVSSMAAGKSEGVEVKSKQSISNSDVVCETAVKKKRLHIPSKSNDLSPSCGEKDLEKNSEACTNSA